MEVTAAKVLDVGCKAEPATGYPGDVITVTATSVNFEFAKACSLHVKTNGGKLKPDQAQATIDTTGLAPGEYEVSAHVVQGMKARAAGLVHDAVPLSRLNLRHSPAQPIPSATAGTVIDISTTGTSPQNRPLTSLRTTSARVRSGEGPTAKLSTAGLTATTITVTCNVTVDDLVSAQANTQVG